MIKITNTQEIGHARKILGISNSATESEVRKKYKELVKKWHPDINNRGEAHEKMKEINHAFELIMKNEFGVLDVWKDYDKWWFQQFKNDSLCGGGPSEEDNKQEDDKNVITYSKTAAAKNEKARMIDEFLAKDNIFAVIGVSKNPKKYGNKVYFDLKDAGYVVYPVNPNADEIQGDKCYSSLSNLPEKPDVIVMVTPPEITEKTIREDLIELGIKKVWLQPGSESEDIINFCKFVKIKVLHGICVMIERKKEI